MGFLSTGSWVLLVGVSLVCIGCFVADAHSCINERNVTAPRGANVKLWCYYNGTVGWRDGRNSYTCEMVEDSSIIHEYCKGEGRVSVGPKSDMVAGIHSITLYNVTENDTGPILCGEENFARKEHKNFLTVLNESVDMDGCLSSDNGGCGEHSGFNYSCICEVGFQYNGSQCIEQGWIWTTGSVACVITVVVTVVILMTVVVIILICRKRLWRQFRQRCAERNTVEQQELATIDPNDDNGARQGLLVAPPVGAERSTVVQQEDATIDPNDDNGARQGLLVAVNTASAAPPVSQQASGEFNRSHIGSELRQMLEPRYGLYGQLEHFGLFSNESRLNLESETHRTVYGRVDRLLQFINYNIRCPQFKEALKGSGQQHVVNFIENSEGEGHPDNIWPLNDHQRRVWCIANTSGIEMSPDFINRLLERGCINKLQYDVISASNDGLAVFCDIMLRRSVYDYENMVECLNKTGQASVSDWFRDKMEKEAIPVIRTPDHPSETLILNIVEDLRRLFSERQLIALANVLRISSLNWYFVCSNEDELRRLRSDYNNGELIKCINTVCTDFCSEPIVLKAEWSQKDYNECLHRLRRRRNVLADKKIHQLPVEILEGFLLKSITTAYSQRLLRADLNETYEKPRTMVIGSKLPNLEIDVEASSLALEKSEKPGDYIDSIAMGVSGESAVKDYEVVEAEPVLLEEGRTPSGSRVKSLRQLALTVCRQEKYRKEKSADDENKDQARVKDWKLAGMESVQLITSVCFEWSQTVLAREHNKLTLRGRFQKIRRYYVRRYELEELIEPDFGLLNLLPPTIVFGVPEGLLVTDRNRRLLDNLMKANGRDVHTCFIAALKYTGQQHIVNYIECMGVNPDRFNEVFPLSRDLRKRIMWRELRQLIEISDGKLLAYLHQHEVITAAQKECIEKSTDNLDKPVVVDLLLDVMKRRSLNSFNKFVSYLKSSDKKSDQIAAELLTTKERCKLSGDMKTSLVDIVDADFGLLERLRDVLTGEQYTLLRSLAGNYRIEKLMEFVNLLPEDEFFAALQFTGQQHVVNFIKKRRVDDRYLPLSNVQRKLVESNAVKLAGKPNMNLFLRLLHELKCITSEHYHHLIRLKNNHVMAVDSLMNILLKRSQADYFNFVDAVKCFAPVDEETNLSPASPDFQVGYVPDIIHRNFAFLIDSVDPVSLMERLFKEEVITQAEIRYIYQDRGFGHETARLLLVLSRKPVEQFERFLGALEQTGQIHVAEKLRYQSFGAFSDFRMPSSDRDAVREMWPKLMECLDVNVRLLAALCAYHVISEDQIHLLQESATGSEKVFYLRQIIMSSPAPNALELFRDAVLESEQVYVAEQVITPIMDKHRERHGITLLRNNLQKPDIAERYRQKRHEALTELARGTRLVTPSSDPAAAAMVNVITANVATVAVSASEHNDHLGTLHFDTTMRDDWVTWTHDNMLQHYDYLEGGRDDNILEIRVFESALNSWQFTLKLFFHSFTVIKTERWWYSIDTSERNIIMQRSKDLHDVLEKCEGKKRITPKMVISAQGRYTFRNVLNYLHERNLLNRPYSLLVENCNDLAKWLFDRFNSEGKIYRLTFIS